MILGTGPSGVKPTVRVDIETGGAQRGLPARAVAQQHFAPQRAVAHRPKMTERLQFTELGEGQLSWDFAILIDTYTAF